MKTTRKRKATKVGRKAGKTSAAQFLQDNAGMALRRGRDTISRAYGWAHEAAEGAHLPNLRMPRRSDITHLTEASPLLLGAVGLGIGVALGTLLPRRIGRSISTRRADGRAQPVKAGRARPAKAAGRRRRKLRTSAKTPAKTPASTAAAG
jgi:hypothetical protein